MHAPDYTINYGALYDSHGHGEQIHVTVVIRLLAGRDVSTALMPPFMQRGLVSRADDSL